MSGLSAVTALLRYSSLPSTSDEARRYSMKGEGGPPFPFVVWADRQTRGRGRSNRSWWSDSGSLTFTLALDPSAYALRSEHEPRLSLVAALAILDAVESLGLRIPGLGVRWPNDVEVGDRKLAGLLPEGIDTPAGRRILIGIGLNLSTRFDDAPPEVARMAASLTSLGLDDAMAADPARVLDLIVDHLGRLLALLAAEDLGLAERWNAVDLLRGRRVRIDLGPRILKGTARGIGPDGALWVEPERGGLPESVMGGQVLRDRPSL